MSIRLSIFRAQTLAAVVALLAITTTGARAQSAEARRDAAECGRFRPEMKQARDLITHNRAQAAKPIVAKALSAEPNNIMANYLAGLIKVNEGSAQVQREGLRDMERAAAMIPSRPASCAVERNWYSLHVTIGAEYFNRGDRATAKRHYAIAYAQRAQLAPQSRQILLDNMGRVALSEGDTKAAIAYYEEGQRAGLPGARDMIVRIKRLQSASR